MRTTIIGITGGHDTGKTTLLESLKETLVSKHGFHADYTAPADKSRKDHDYILSGVNVDGNPIKVAICTAGDTQEIVKDNIQDIKTNNNNVLPDYFISACRVDYSETDGYFSLVEEAKKNDYGWYAIRMSPIEPQTMNDYKIGSIIARIMI